MTLIKRCIISKDGQFRVSNPGIDVSSTNTFDFMLHEDFLSAQPYHFSFVDCPFAGYSGNDAKTQAVSVTVPDIDSNPVIIIYPVTNASLNTFPFPRDQGSGTDQAGYNVDSWQVDAKMLSSTNVSVRFVKAADGTKSPAGAYLVLVRAS